MTNEAYVMHKRGQFRPSKFTKNQCKSQNHDNYFYHIIFVTDCVKDKNGFILDHNLIDQSIQNSKIKGSCEEMHDIIMQIFLEKVTPLIENNVYAYKCILSPTLPNGSAYLEKIGWSYTGKHLLHLL